MHDLMGAFITTNKQSKIELKNINVTGVNFLARSFFIKHIFVKANKTNKYEAVDIPILSDVNIEINHGERVGFIGYNGSGKSSLIKVITGIYPPKSGTVKVKGKVTAIIEMGLGFDTEITGRENIKLGLLYSNRLDEYSKELEQEIIGFSELGDKIDMPLKYYSSGMLSRLAFSVCAFQDSDILILDEVFAAGDAKFVEKSSEFMKKKFNSSSISIMVSHSEGVVQENCTRCIWLDKGKIIADGDTKDVLNEYNKNIRTFN